MKRGDLRWDGDVFLQLTPAKQDTLYLHGMNKDKPTMTLYAEFVKLTEDEKFERSRRNIYWSTLI